MDKTELIIKHNKVITVMHQVIEELKREREYSKERSIAMLETAIDEMENRWDGKPLINSPQNNSKVDWDNQWTEGSEVEKKTDTTNGFADYDVPKEK